ncbi:TonB-dependent receptor [Flavitalea sp.]|nr:TonB-dependent receptor plug domain-containing protein [Flavitalea sp.]
MRKVWIGVVLLCGGQQICAQSDTSSLEEVVVSASKFKSSKQGVSQKIDVIGQPYISKVNAQNTGDLLTSTGNIFVQKSQQGGSSPVIRGFEASRVLLVVDGIRMNNAIYRAGHLQNVITVDQNMLERVEIMYGPSSTLYGSDALGGSLHFTTRAVKLPDAEKKMVVNGNAFLRYSSANNERTGHADINIGFKKIGFLTSVTFSDFDDLKMGRNYPDKYPDFGRRTSYVDVTGTPPTDLVMSNNDDRVQKYSGYLQWDLLEKITFQHTKNVSHTLNLQLSNSTNVPRYDRLQDLRNGTLRYAEWFYGPQKRNLAAYILNVNNIGALFDDFRLTVSYQDISESRQQRDYQRYDRFDSRRENIKVFGAVADARKRFGDNEITVGADAQLNDLNSIADRTNLLTGAVSKLDTRYPDGKNRMNHFAVYAQHALSLEGGKWKLNDGIRLQTVNLHSTINDNSFFSLPVTDMKYNLQSLTGNLGLVYQQPTWKGVINVSSGFRAPNIDDLARIFESSTSVQRVVIPNAGIKPEYTYNTDLGFSGNIAKMFKWDVSVFYTSFRNAITLAPYQLNGQDSIIYNGTKSQVVANQNLNKAYMYGFSAKITATLNKHFSLYSTLNYTKGRYKTDEKTKTNIYQEHTNGEYILVQANVKEKPMDHIPPMFGLTSFEYKNEWLSAEVFGQYFGWKKLSEYNADGEDNAQYATADGMPAWITLNLRTSIKITENLRVQGAIENITDRNYRNFASGFSAPGRNFILSLRTAF